MSKPDNLTQDELKLLPAYDVIKRERNLVRNKRVYSVEDYSEIIRMRYGSLEDFTSPKMRPIDISKALGMPPNTVENILHRFIKNGFKLF